MKSSIFFCYYCQNTVAQGKQMAWRIDEQSDWEIGEDPWDSPVDQYKSI